MSFILDALKKSESDRQRQSGPALFEVKVAPRRVGLPLWAVAIGVLLGINLIIVMWMLLRAPGTPRCRRRRGRAHPGTRRRTPRPRRRRAARRCRLRR